jgi:hypothetical protein
VSRGRIAWGLSVGLASLALGACGSSDSGTDDSTEPTTHAGASSPATGGAGGRGDRGEERVAVPKLVGESFDDAVRDVRVAGLRQQVQGFPGTVGNPDNEGSCLEILSQAPPPGAKVPGGDTISIVFGACRSAITKGRLGKDAGRPH